MNDTYAKRWPLLRNTKLFLGVGDGACANIGSKCTRMNRIACTIGTSAAARVCLYYPIILEPNHPPKTNDDTNCQNGEITTHASVESSWSKLQIPHGLFCYRIDRHHVLIGGALTDGGNVIEWINHHLLFTPKRNNENMSTTTTPTAADVATSSSSEFDLAMQDAAQLLYHDYNAYHLTSVPPTSSSSLMVIPFFSGERNTGYRSNATGVMIGLTLQTRSHHIVKACLEGITLRLYAIIQLIVATVTPWLQQQHQNINNDLDELSMMILCSGKALEKNQLWRTMIADCTGLPVYMEKQTYEGTSRGVAILIHHALFPLVSCRNGRFVVEDIMNDFNPFVSDTCSETNVIVQTPDTTVHKYWMALFDKQVEMIKALSTTSHWS
jgi:gluconokinase